MVRSIAKQPLCGGCDLAIWWLQKCNLHISSQLHVIMNQIFLNSGGFQLSSFRGAYFRTRHATHGASLSHVAHPQVKLHVPEKNQWAGAGNR